MGRRARHPGRPARGAASRCGRATPGAIEDRRSPRLPDARLPDVVTVTGDFPDRADALLLAVPVQHLAGVLEQLPTAGRIVACAKGVEAGTLRLPLEIVDARWPGRARAPC